jgi:hypothetical protein
MHLVQANRIVRRRYQLEVLFALKHSDVASLKVIAAHPKHTVTLPAKLNVGDAQARSIVDFQIVDEGLSGSEGIRAPDL